LQNMQQYGIQGQQLSLAQQKQLQDYQLGMGGLGVQQQQVQNQANQFGQTFGLQSLQNQQQYGLQSDSNALARQLGLGNMGLQQQQVNNQANQFGQTFGLQQQSQDLAKQLGLGNLDLSRQQVGNQASQFGQTLNMQQQQNQTQNQQFMQQLAQQLGLATMGDKTTNRSIDVQSQSGNNALMMALAGLGIGGGMTGASGASGTGAAGGAGGAFGSASYLNSPAVQALQQSNPALYAQMQLAGDHSNWGNSTVNFGGQQYSVQDYYKLMQSHPELFKMQTPGDLSQEASTPGQLQTPKPVSDDPFQAWWDQHGNGGAYQSVGNSTVDNRLTMFDTYKNMSPQQRALADPNGTDIPKFLNDPAILAAYQKAQSENAARGAYRASHGGWEGGYDPNKPITQGTK
jgi:hypothetical protein